MHDIKIIEYCSGLNSLQLQIFHEFKKLVEAHAPGSVEIFSYGMPCFKYKNKYLIGIGVFKNHMSIFPGSEITELFKDELKNYKTSKGTVQFTAKNKIPDNLLVKIIRQRVKYIEESLKK